MRERIAVLGSSEEASQELCATLERRGYQAVPLRWLSDLDTSIRESDLLAVILDLDDLPVDNRFLRDLRKQNPEVHVIGLSGRTFHPELQEAMRNDISACLGKPIDEEELIYWLKSICVQ